MHLWYWYYNALMVEYNQTKGKELPEWFSGRNLKRVFYGGIDNETSETGTN